MIIMSLFPLLLMVVSTHSKWYLPLQAVHRRLQWNKLLSYMYIYNILNLNTCEMYCDTYHFLLHLNFIILTLVDFSVKWHYFETGLCSLLLFSVLTWLIFWNFKLSCEIYPITCIENLLTYLKVVFAMQLC